MDFLPSRPRLQVYLRRRHDQSLVPSEPLDRRPVLNVESRAIDMVRIDLNFRARLSSVQSLGSNVSCWNGPPCSQSSITDVSFVCAAESAANARDRFGPNKALSVAPTDRFKEPRPVMTVNGAADPVWCNAYLCITRLISCLAQTRQNTADQNV